MNRYTIDEAIEAAGMVKLDKFDIRTVTLGINLLPAADSNPRQLTDNIKRLIVEKAKKLKNEALLAEKNYGIPIINKRITVTPIAAVISPALTGNKEKDMETALSVARVLDQTAEELKIDFIGGYGCFTEKGIGYAEKIIIESLPAALTKTLRVCAFVNIGTTKAGINMRAVAKMGAIIHQISGQNSGHLGCAKLVIFCNSVPDNPFMAGGYHGLDQADEVINIGISGPGAIRRVIEKMPDDLPLDEAARQIQNAAFKITRAGELVGKEIAASLAVRFGSIDLSLAPTSEEGDSVGLIIEKLGLETAGTHGSTAALALVTDAVKKGGMMATTSFGGLSGAFIPVSEDKSLSLAVKKGILTIDKLEAMTAVCSVGLDMILIPGDTRSTAIAAIIADEAAIGMINHKTTGTRLIPIKDKKAGDFVKLGGLFGEGYILPVHQALSERFVWRKGRIPPPVTSARN